MLPFLKRDKEASVSVPGEAKIRKADDPADDYDVLHSAAEDLISAVHSKNIKAVAEALRAAYELCGSEPEYGDE